MTWQTTHALSAHSKARFKQHKRMSPLHFPSISSMQKAEAENRVSDGRNTKVYEMRAATLQVSGKHFEYCYAMSDKIHLKSGVKFHSATGATIDLENDSLDESSVLHRLLSEGNGKVEKATKENQWLLISFGTSKYQSFVGEFYFNNGSLTGETLMNQFL